MKELSTYMRKKLSREVSLMRMGPNYEDLKTALITACYRMDSGLEDSLTKRINDRIKYLKSFLFAFADGRGYLTSQEIKDDLVCKCMTILMYWLDVKRLTKNIKEI